MFSLEVQTHFDAAHRLPDYNGPCRRIHGHRWEVKARYFFNDPLQHGMVYDLVLLKNALHSIVATYDHQSLNDVMNITPTAELIAQTIWNRLRALPDPVHRQHLCAVSVYETPDTCVVYTETLADVVAALRGKLETTPLTIEKPSEVEQPTVSPDAPREADEETKNADQ